MSRRWVVWRGITTYLVFHFVFSLRGIRAAAAERTGIGAEAVLYMVVVIHVTHIRHRGAAGGVFFSGYLVYFSPFELEGDGRQFKYVVFCFLFVGCFLFLPFPFPGYFSRFRCLLLFLPSSAVWPKRLTPSRPPKPTETIATRVAA